MNETRMREIETRLAEIRTAVEAPDADLDALEEESRSLTTEYETLAAQNEEAERRNKILEGAKRRGTVTRRFTDPGAPEERTYGVDTPEYRSAYLRNLQGRELLSLIHICSLRRTYRKEKPNEGSESLP